MSYYFYQEKEAAKAREELQTWTNVESLNISFSDDALVKEMFASPAIASLQDLTLRQGALEAGLACLVANLPPDLKTLSLEPQGVFDITGLSDVLGQNQIESLFIRGTINNTFGTVLSSTDSIEALHMTSCLTPELCNHLAPYLEGIPTLELGYNAYGDKGLIALLGHKGWQESVTTLSLSSANLTPAAGQMLAEASFPKLRSLSLGGNARFGDAGVIAMLKAPWLTHLNTLRLSASSLGNDGARALANCASLANLKELGAMGAADPGGEEGALAIAQSSHLSALTHLWFHPTHISAEGCIDIMLARPGVRNLYHVEKKCSAKALRAKAKSLGLRGYSKMNKTQLFTLIRSAI